MSRKINNKLAIAVIIIVAVIVSGLIWFGERKQNNEINQFSTQASKKNAPTNTITTTPADNQAIDSMKICDGISQITDSRDTSNSIYNTVAIGSQCWLERNLNVGSKINGAKKQTDNSKLEKYCYSNDEGNCNIDGGLYTWNEAMQYSKKDGTQGICPSGWHIPSDYDWVALESYLAGIEQKDCNNFGEFTWGCECSGSRTGFGCEPVGKKLESKSLCLENYEQAVCGTSGFNAVYPGYRNDYFSELFIDRGDVSIFWSSTKYNSVSAYSRYLFAKWNDGIARKIYFTNGSVAMAIRCIKD